MKLIIPKKLNKGDVIGVVSPSAGLGPIFPHRIKQAEKNLTKLGFKVKYAKNSLKNDGYISASAEERANDIHEMFLDNDVKAVISTIGGDHSNQILKYLDFDIVRNNPKIFIGYSDITILHFAFATKSNLRTYYGPCIISEFGEYPEILSYTLEYFKKTLMVTKSIGNIPQSDSWTWEFLDWFKKKDQTRARKMTLADGYEWWKEGKAQGQIFGGCVPSMNHLAGTDYWLDFRDKIMFIDIPELNPGEKFPIADLDSFLADLDNLGIFKKIKGLIIGRPYFYEEDDNKDLRRIIDYYTNDYDYPILFNMNIGHVSPIITLPLGAEVMINSQKNTFEIKEAGVTE
ncbi:S66 family peptidase [Desulfonauticus submarinus]